MDKTEIYIKMCEKAEEIQALKGSRDKYSDWDSGDVYSFEGVVNVFEGWAFSEGAIEDDIITGRCIWLPRQDDLQKMVSDRPNYPWDMEDNFYNFCHQNYVSEKDTYGFWNDYTGSFTSMEQLWLAFVMKENYNKIWNGEDWINE